MSSNHNEDELRQLIVKHTSEMLDNPDEYGIYPTTKFYNNLENDLMQLIHEHTEEQITQYIKPHLDYCQEQNGLLYCKNCGLEQLQDSLGGK